MSEIQQVCQAAFSQAADDNGGHLSFDQLLDTFNDVIQDGRVSDDDVPALVEIAEQAFDEYVPKSVFKGVFRTLTRAALSQIVTAALYRVLPA